MNKKTSILLFLVLLSVIISGYYYLNYIRYKEHNMYHRSRMFEYELLSNLYEVFPIGTPVEEVLSKLELDKSVITEGLQDDYSSIDILPELPIPKDEQRDYSGYYIQFKDDRLVCISPVGPDIAQNEIKLSTLEIGKQIHYGQKP